jgi:hypothetical protein
MFIHQHGIFFVIVARQDLCSLPNSKHVDVDLGEKQRKELELISLHLEINSR